MFVSKYTAKQDNWTLMRLMKKRDKSPREVFDLPEVGFVAYEENYMIGAGFLRKCEGNFAIFDSYITDPKMPAKIRDQALEIITKHLMDAARTLGVKRLLALSVDANTITRSQRHGFVLMDHKVLSKAL